MNYIATLFAMAICINASAQTKWNYPPTPKIPVYDTIWGKVIKDDYRWMEKYDSPEFLNWVNAQNKFTDSVKQLIPGQDALAKEFLESIKNSGYEYRHIQRSEEFWVYQKFVAADGTNIIYKRSLKNNKEDTLLNPEKFRRGVKYTVQELETFSKGNLALIKMYASGTEITTGYVMNLNTGKLFTDTITGFEPKAMEINGEPYIIYAKSGTNDVRSENYYRDLAITIHKVGSNAKDINIYQQSKMSNGKVSPDEFYRFYSSPNSPFALVLYYNGKQEENIVHYTKKSSLLKPNIPWKILKPGDVEMHEGLKIGLTNNAFYYLTTLKNSSGEIRKSPFNDREKSKVVFTPPSGWLIKDIAFSKNNLVISTSRNSVETQLYSLDLVTDKVLSVGKPMKGAGFLNSAGLGTNLLTMTNTTWTEPANNYLIHAVSGKISSEFFTQKNTNEENKNIVVEEVEVKAEDGAMIPLSIVYDKSKFKKDGSNLAHIYAYGSFGIISQPSYTAVLNLLLKSGFVMTTAHVRGGGEKGADWCNAGKLENAANKWKDFNACAEWLIKNKYTSPERLSITGTSAGGFLMGRVVTSRPELYNIAFPNVGLLNPYRAHVSANGSAFNEEIGDIKKENEAPWVLDADPYLQIKTGTRYPAQYITAGYNDPRVVVWQPAKYAAAMQAASSGNGPILLYVNMDGGHFNNSTPQQTAARMAWAVAFRFWQAGFPEYQPKN